MHFYVNDIREQGDLLVQCSRQEPISVPLLPIRAHGAPIKMAETAVLHCKFLFAHSINLGGKPLGESWRGH